MPKAEGGHPDTLLPFPHRLEINKALRLLSRKYLSPGYENSRI
jgi:hypothetical protein